MSMYNMDLEKYITLIPPISINLDMHSVFDCFRKNKSFVFFPVVDNQDQPLGIVREVDLKDYAYGMFGRDLIKREKVGRFVKPCPTVDENTPIEEILLMMGCQVSVDGIIITREKKYVGVISNMSLLNIYEEIRQHVQRQMLQVQNMESIGTLAGGIAHDFNNILVPIIGYAELIKMTFDVQKNPISKYLDQILVAANRAKELVSQILSFSRQQNTERAPLNLSPIIREVMKLLRSSLPSTIDIQTHIQTDEDCIIADPTEIHQILMNLCTNAAHAMRLTGGILTVCLDAHHGPHTGWSDHKELLAEKKYIRLSVQDTGDGIPQAILPRIFDPFFTTKKQGEGTGMGLAVVHGIVKSSGGLISVETEEGHGCTFNFYFPVVSADSIKNSANNSTHLFGRKGEGIHVLFVDDEQMILDIAALSLGELGFQVTVCSSSHEALELFRESPNDFDVVVIDQTMPELTGLELSKQILKIRNTVPIIMATGYSELVTSEVALANGIRVYLLKPINFQEMSDKILSLVRSSSSQKN